MIAELSPMLTAVGAYWAQLVFVFLRCGAMVALLPGFGEQVIPMRVRLAIAIAVTVAVLPMTGPPPDGLRFAVAAAEVTTGLLLGALLRFLIFALQLAGSIAAQSTSLAQIFGGGVTPDPSPAMGNVLLLGGLSLFAIAGGHVDAVIYVASSFFVVPIGTFPDPEVMLQLGLQGAGEMMRLALRLAMPFVIAGLLYNVVLGAVNRAMPQLMVAFVGAPAITAGGLALLALSGPVLLDVWLDGIRMFALVPPWGAQ